MDALEWPQLDRFLLPIAGGANMRGDMKWPPEECKQQVAKENEDRLRLAAGPECRPRRIAKVNTFEF